MDPSSQLGTAADVTAGRVIDTYSSPAAIREAISQRLANIENAVCQALETGSGVIIWQHAT